MLMTSQPLQPGRILRDGVPLSLPCLLALFFFVLPFHFPLASRKQNVKADALSWKKDPDLDARLINRPCLLFLCLTAAVAEDEVAKDHQVTANNMLLAWHCDGTASTNL